MLHYVDQYNNKLAVGDSVGVHAPEYGRYWLARVIALEDRNNQVVVEYSNSKQETQNTHNLLKVQQLEESHGQLWGYWESGQFEAVANPIQRWLNWFKGKEASLLQELEPVLWRYQRQKNEGTLSNFGKLFDELHKAELALAYATRARLQAMEEQVQWYMHAAHAFQPSREILESLRAVYAKINNELQLLPHNDMNFYNAKDNPDNDERKFVDKAIQIKINDVDSKLSTIKSRAQQYTNTAIESFKRFHSLRRMHVNQMAITVNSIEQMAKRCDQDVKRALRVVNLYIANFIALSNMCTWFKLNNKTEYEKSLRWISDTYKTIIG
jgi:hypothetical protein